MLFLRLHFHLLLLFYFISVWFQKIITVLVTDNNTESIIARICEINQIRVLNSW